MRCKLYRFVKCKILPRKRWTQFMISKMLQMDSQITSITTTTNVNGDNLGVKKQFMHLKIRFHFDLHLLHLHPSHKITSFIIIKRYIITDLYRIYTITITIQDYYDYYYYYFYYHPDDNIHLLLIGRWWLVSRKFARQLSVLCVIAAHVVNRTISVACRRLSWDVRQGTIKGIEGKVSAPMEIGMVEIQSAFSPIQRIIMPFSMVFYADSTTCSASCTCTFSEACQMSGDVANLQYRNGLHWLVALQIHDDHWITQW